MEKDEDEISRVVDFPTDDQEIDDTSLGTVDVIAAYIAEGPPIDDLPDYSDELGLAIEKIKEGYTLKKLWEVIQS